MIKKLKVLNRIWKDIIIFGPLNTVWIYIIKVLKKIINFDIIIIIQRPLTKTIDRIQPEINVVHKIIGMRQMEEIIEGKYEFEREERFDDLKQVYQKLRKELTGNRVVCISIVNNKIVAWKWLDFEHISIPDLNLKIKLPDKHIYFFDSYTVPSYRGKNIQPNASEYVFNILRAQGIEGCLGYVSFVNLSSISCLKKSRWRKKGCIYSIELKKKKRIYFSRQLQELMRGNLSPE